MTTALDKAVERLEARGSEKRDCSVCDGYGKVQRYDPPYGQRDCGGCDATGERHVLDQRFREDLRRTLNALREQGEALARYEEALTPSGDTKSAFHGEFSWMEEMTDLDGEIYTHKVFVPWTTVREIMAAIKARAALTRSEVQ